MLGEVVTAVAEAGLWVETESGRAEALTVQGVTPVPSSRAGSSVRSGRVGPAAQNRGPWMRRAPTGHCWAARCLPSKDPVAAPGSSGQRTPSSGR